MKKGRRITATTLRIKRIEDFLNNNLKPKN